MENTKINSNIKADEIFIDYRGGTSSGRLSIKTEDKKADLGETLDSRISQLEVQLVTVKEQRETLKKLESNFKRKDVVFHRDVGPAIFSYFEVYEPYKDYPRIARKTLERRPFKEKDILAIVMTDSGPMGVYADELVPYTESVKLLYEQEERNNS